MLWSLIKIVLFIGIVAGLALVAGWLSEVEEGIRIALLGYEFTLGPLMAAIAAALLLVAVWLVLKLSGLLMAVYHFLHGDETAISRFFSRNRERKGYRALSDALIALASGESRLAITKAERAERALRRPDLTNPILAQAAEMSGEHERAEKVYKALLADDKTRFIGVRGLMKQRLDSGDTDTAMKLAEKAFALKPKHAEIQDILLTLQAQHGDWKGARKTLGAKLKSGHLPRDVHKRRDAVLALGAAREIAEHDTPIAAREAAIEANRLSPDLIPAAAIAARQYTANQQDRYAARVIKKAWEAQPHPDLAAAFADIKPDETPAQRLNRFQLLTRIHPDHPETRMLLAELNIAAEDFPAARRALGDLATSHPTARSLTIMAAIERGEGADDAVVRGWLAKALTAPRGPQWVCDKCQHVEGRWDPICSNCGAFDTLSWREPPVSKVALPAGTAMLPLIVGQIAQRPAPEDEADVPGPEHSDEAEPAHDDAEEPTRPGIIDAEVVSEDADEGRPGTTTGAKN